MTFQEFIDKKVVELKKLIYQDDPGLESFGEHDLIVKYVKDFISDLKKEAKNKTS